MPQPMMRSIDTCDGRRHADGQLADRLQHRLGPAGVDGDRRGGRADRRAPARAAPSRARACPGSRPRWRARGGRRAARTSPGRTGRRPAGRRRTASSVCRSACSASASVANGARPTPPATIQASAGGATGVNGLPSGPRHPMRSPGAGVDTAARCRRRRACSASRSPPARPPGPRRISNTENGRRSSGSEPVAGLHHHELAGRGRCRRSRGAPARARCSRARGECWTAPRRPRRPGMA